MYKFLFLTLVWLLWSQQATAGHRLQEEYFVDESRSLSAEDIVSRMDELQWQKAGMRPTRFGYTRARIWFRFRLPLDQLTYGSHEPVMLSIPNAYLDRVELYRLREGKLEKNWLAGMGVSISERGPKVLRTGTPTFRISPPRMEKDLYLVSIEGDFPLALPLELIEAQDYAYHHWTGVIFVGIFLGMLLLSSLYNAFLALSLKSRVYWSYALFVIAVGMLYLGHEGLTTQLIWRESPWWIRREMHVYGALAILFYAFFVREFLGSRLLTPWLDRILLALVGVSLVRAVWMLFALDQTVAMIGEAAVVLSNFMILAIALRCLWMGIRSALYFVLASSVFNLSVILFVLQETNVIYIGEFMSRVPHIGTAIEVVLLSLALGDRIRLTNLELALQRSAMVHAEKMGALGRMAGEIAHEINNPLAIIQGNATLLSKLDLAPEAKSIAFTIEQTSIRISKVVKGMRALARDTRSDPLQVTPVASVIQDTLVLCHDRFTNTGVRLFSPEASPGLMVRCRSSEVCQVLVNLMNNAIDALEGRSGAWVKLEVQEVGGFLEFSVSDNGVGVPKAIRARIHDPFFTTKEAGKGLGLGLSISRTIVEAHGGQIWLDESCPHTRFVFTIPLAAKGAGS